MEHLPVGSTALCCYVITGDSMNRAWCINHSRDQQCFSIGQTTHTIAPSPSTTWFTWASSAPLNDFSHVCGAHPCNQHTATPRHLWNLQQQAASKQRMRVMRPDDVSQQTHTNCLTGLHWWGYFQLNHISRASVNTTAAVDHPPCCHSTKNKCQNTTNENPQHWLTGLTPSAFNS